MDQNSAVIDEKIKEDVRSSLLQKIILGLETNQMNLVQKRQSAAFILDNFDSINSYKDLIFFLDSLKVRWAIFTDVCNIFKNKYYQEKEKDVINKLTSYIHRLN